MKQALAKDMERTLLMNRSGVKAGAIAYFILALCVNTILTLLFSSISIVLFGTISALVAVYFISKTDGIAAYLSVLIKIVLYVSIFLIYFGNIAVYNKPYYIGGSDDLFFEQRSLEYWIGEDIYLPWQDHWPSNIKGFLWIISTMMRISGVMDGYHTIAFRILNTDILLATGCIIYLICVKYLGFSLFQARTSMLAFSLFPNAVTISSYVFRDTISVFLLIAAYYLCEKMFCGIWFQNKTIKFFQLKPVDAIVFILVCFFAYWIRREILFYILVIILLSFISKGEITLSTFAKYIVPILVLLMFFGVTGVLKNVQDMIYYYGLRLVDDAAAGGEEALSNIVFNRPLIPFGWLFRIAYAWVSPVPVGLFKIITDGINGFTISNFFVGLGTCFQVIMLTFLVPELKKKDKMVWTYLLIFLTIIITTFGFRHFILLYPFQCMLVARNYYRHGTDYRKSRMTIGVLLLVFLGIIYVILKII